MLDGILVAELAEPNAQLVAHTYFTARVDEQWALQTVLRAIQGRSQLSEGVFDVSSVRVLWRRVGARACVVLLCDVSESLAILYSALERFSASLDALLTSEGLLDGGLSRGVHKILALQDSMFANGIICFDKAED